MTDLFVPRVGGVLSADIAVPEHEREVRFYARVLGTGAEPLWREDLMNNHGAPIIGLGERVLEYAHLPLQWMPHIQVADVGASVERALELGGVQLMLDEQARWAVLQDPWGAAFGIMPVVPAEALPHPGGNASDTGHIAGIDLTAADAEAARDFYSQVVGWSARPGDGDVAFAMDAADGHPVARIYCARDSSSGPSARDADADSSTHDASPDSGARSASADSSTQGASSELPAVWLLRLPVGDLEESLRRVREEGGEVLGAADPASGYAAIQDPVGACLALVQG